jgi:hypothetical protein
MEEYMSGKDVKVIKKMQNGSKQLISILSTSGIITGILLVVISRFTGNSFLTNLLFGVGLALAPSGIIGLIGDYLVFGRTMESLNISNSLLAEQVTELTKSTDFLKRSSSLGLEMIYYDRTTALRDFVIYMKNEAQQKENIGKVVIVGSSIKGLLEEAKDFLTVIETAIRNNCSIKILLTHPEYSQYRENQEGRPSGAIEDEIFDGIRIIESTINNNSCEKLQADNIIKLYKGTPTCFMIIAGDRMLINPYPYEEEAYKSFCIVVKKVEPNEANMDGENIMYTKYARAHYIKPWNRNSVPYNHFLLEGPNPEVVCNYNNCYGDIFVVQDAGHFYIAVYLNGQSSERYRGLATSIKTTSSSIPLTVPNKFSVRLFESNTNQWKKLDDHIGCINLHSDRRRGKISGIIKGNLLNDFCMIGLFDFEDRVINPNKHIDSAMDGLHGTSLPIFWKWLN